MQNSSYRSAILLSEEGWHIVREISLRLSQTGLQSHVIIKGDPGREVKQFISRRERVQNYFIPRLLFRGILPFLLCILSVLGGVGICVFTKERTAKMLKPFCNILNVKLIRLIEQGHTFSLLDDKGNSLQFDQLIDSLSSKKN